MLVVHWAERIQNTDSSDTIRLMSHVNELLTVTIGRNNVLCVMECNYLLYIRSTDDWTSG